MGALNIKDVLIYMNKVLIMTFFFLVGKCKNTDNKNVQKQLLY